MAYKRISAVYFLADSKEDLKNIPTPKMGAECFVIEDACEYKITSTGKWVKQSAATSSSGESVDLTGYATEDYVDNAVEGISIPSVDGLASEEFVEEAIASIAIPSLEGLATEEFVNQAIIDATHVEDIYGDAHMFGLMVDSDENRTLIEAMLAKGKGMYNFHVEKGSPGLPDAVVAKNSSCRGICCVDTYRSDTNWYGWILMYDQDGDVYTQYIRNAEPKGWKQVAFV